MLTDMKVTGNNFKNQGGKKKIGKKKNKEIKKKKKEKKNTPIESSMKNIINHKIILSLMSHECLSDWNRILVPLKHSGLTPMKLLDQVYP